MGNRVEVVFPERTTTAPYNDRAHLGKSGVMTSLDKSTGRAQVTFDSGETVTIDAGCLQYLESEAETEAETEAAAEAERDEPEIGN